MLVCGAYDVGLLWVQVIIKRKFLEKEFQFYNENVTCCLHYKNRSINGIQPLRKKLEASFLS